MHDKVLYSFDAYNHLVDEIGVSDVLPSCLKSEDQQIKILFIFRKFFAEAGNPDFWYGIC